MKLPTQVRPSKVRLSVFRSITTFAHVCAISMVGLLGGSANAQLLLHRYDFSANANDSVGVAHGTLKGGATISGGSLNTAAVSGSLSGGVPQNGLLLPGSAVAGISGPFTIETWFIVNFGGGYTTLFSFSDSTINSYVLATPARGNFPFASSISVIGGGGNASEQQAGGQYEDNGVLHEMIATYDGTTLSYYLDGALANYPGQPGVTPTITDPGLNLSSLTFIGINGGSAWPDNSINGSTLDFRIYGQSVTPGQAASLYGLGADASSAAIIAAVSPVPEPSSLGLVCVGLASLLAVRRIKLFEERRPPLPRGHRFF